MDSLLDQKKPLLLIETDAISNQTFKLVRGSLARFDGWDLKRMQAQLSGRDVNAVLDWIKAAKVSHNFSETYYSVSFKTNRSILIEKLGFWGPFGRKLEGYNVKIIVSEFQSRLPSFNPADEVVLDRFETEVEAEEAQIFLVDCPRKIRVEEGKWIRIRFQLNGSDTCICSTVQGSYRLRDCATEFQFIDSSYQLPEIHFRLPEPEIV